MAIMARTTLSYKFSRQQVEMMIWELEQSVRGDDDAYDKKLKVIVKKLKEEYDKR